MSHTVFVIDDDGIESWCTRCGSNCVCEQPRREPPEARMYAHECDWEPDYEMED